MRFEIRRSAPLLVALTIVSASASAVQPRGVVNGLTVTPKAARTGTTVSATATGVNPCGAVFIDWGDGTAITHAIVDLPSTQTHAYSQGGDYTVRAKGMGNCDGEVTASVRIEGPGPAATQPKLTGLTVASPGGRGEPVNMRMEGQGSCNVIVAFGDGNTQEFSVQLPHTFTHVYSLARGYNVTAAAISPCEGGRHTARLEVAEGPTRAKPRGALERVVVAPLRARARTRVNITIEGRGTCRVFVDFGDGDEQTYDGELPVRISHTFTRPGSYEVFAWTELPCSGDASGVVQIAR